MIKQEQSLREKLGLSIDDKLECKNFDRITRNKNYILEVNNQKKYFMKIDSEGLEKEKLMYSFLKENKGLLNTIFPEYCDNRMIIFPFIERLKDEKVKNNLDFILSFHNASLALPKQKFEDYLKGPSMDNHYVRKFINRLERHQEMVENFWGDIPSLVEFYHLHPQQKFERIPKIFVHGDIQHKNLQKSPDGQVYLLDFEDIYYDSPSWDLSRVLMDLEKNEIEDYLKEYVLNVNIKEKNLVIEEINRNFVIRIITDIIGRQQRFGLEGARPYLNLYKEKYSNKLKEIIYAKN